MIRTTIAILSIAALSGACSSSDSGSGLSGGGAGDGSGSDSSGSSTGGEEVPGTLVEGVWETPCQPGEDAFTREFVLSMIEGVFELNENTYGDSGCTNMLSVLITRGSYEEQLVEDGRRPEDGIPIDFIVGQITLEPLLSEVAERFNEEMRCGYSMWLPEEPYTVPSTGCPQFEVVGAPRTDYNRFLVDEAGTPDERSDDTLLLGTLEAQTDALRRPEINAEIALTRRPGSL